MQPSPSFWAGRLVCVTGGSGFLGFHLVRKLRELKARVRVLTLKPADRHPIWSLPDVEIHQADVRNTAAVREAIRGCSVVFHTAGLVAAWGPAVDLMRAVHREGTANILAESERQCRIVHTSSVVAIGASRNKQVLDENSRFTLGNLKVPYVQAKYDAEQIALAGSSTRDVVIVNPGYLVGPEDYEGSVMGRLFLRAWKGRVPLAPPGGLNLVDVRDVTLGHLLAAERGRCGRRYILGGENRTQAELLRVLAEVAGHRPRAVPRLPGFILLPLAHLAEMVSRQTGKEPYPSLGHARLSRYHWYYSWERAQNELGYLPRPLIDSCRDTHEWFLSDRELTLRGLNAWWMRTTSRRAA